MDVQLPDGTIIAGVPDGMSKADLLAKLHKNGHDISGLVSQEKIGKEGFKGTLKQELADNPIGAKFAAFGTAASDLWQGGKQLVGMGNRQDIENNNTLKEANPLSALAGNVAMYAAGGAAAPALNTLKGATIAGGVTGALLPTENDNVALGKLENAAMGAGLGFGGTKLGSAVGNAVSNARQAKQVLQSQNATRDATLQASQDAGFKVPRSLYNPTFASNRLESLGGKAAIKQQAAMENQSVATGLARKYLGLPEDVPLSSDVLDNLRDVASAPYREAAALPAQSSAFSGVGVSPKTNKTGAQLVEEIKSARDDSRAAWKAFNSGNAQKPTEMRQQAKAADALVSNLESQLENLAQNNGKPDLVKSLREARKEIAKIHTIDKAMNDATGDISASNLASQSNRGAPLTDEAKLIADFANAFPQVAQNGAKIPAPGVSKVEAMMAALLGGGGGLAGTMMGGAATGGMGALLGAGLTALPHAARPLALSKALQSTPKYGIGPTKALAEALLASRYSPMALTGATLPSLAQ